MEKFKEYLQGKGYRLATVHEKIQVLQRMRKRQRNLEELTYRQVLNMVDRLKQNYSIATVNNQIRVLEEYYHFLIQIDRRADNPCQKLRIKTPSKQYATSLLTPDELEDLYYSYSINSKTKGYKTAIRYRNKVIVGLMVYQGLGTGSLQLLKVEDVDLRMGKLHVPLGTKLNSRTLKLHSSQILLIQDYLLYHHDTISREIKVNAYKLFPIGHKTKFSSITKQIKNELKLINAKVESLHYIRVCVISHWLSQYNLRKVQIMSGHRTILGIERYRQNDIDDLQEAIKAFFPM